MHSSKMRTTPLLMYPGEGVCLGVCILGGLHGGSVSRGVYLVGSAWGGLHPGGLPRGICIQGGLPSGGLPGRSSSRGVCLGGLASSGVFPLVCLWWGVGQTHPTLNRMTHTCKNITLPQTLFASSNNNIWHLS